ncbi:hypothetical protein [Paenibacillus apiarius]|uniref:Secreted protein n=1 Tax=Paenibacillus apiarius TaxID=46240 RepID=A0ABT4DVX7_9BACL|nr:hypothetical protein [Paenibacillus apiarius]MBN3526711.1 hypothetical protein [Paenibacillus apiarius]MCY9513135.1 hypothetical protein [Paenibacillus apiarius]MCY9521507.1 hypothetical protein [Paenibacillus apiarius]MCY9560551.1 hypothetical protein [Paenibacillus apiarius]MCY9685199.1 hypothetical protein [Paenibacillus apiarius]
MTSRFVRLTIGAARSTISLLAFYLFRSAKGVCAMDSSDSRLSHAELLITRSGEEERSHGCCRQPISRLGTAS